MQREASPETEIRFDDILVELDGHRLFRAGEEIPLEPKAFGVLREMLRRPGHAFTRDELLDTVWGHRHVTPGVLVRVIGLLRRALGDTQERYLQTVHGVGYRLVLPAACVDPAGPATAPVVAVTADVETLAPAVVSKFAAVPVRDASATPAPAAARPRWLYGILILGAALAAVLALYARQGRESVPAPQPVANARDSGTTPTLAVLPLRALGEDLRAQDFADGLSEELITTMAHIDGLRVSAASASFPYRERGLPLPETARRLGASHVLEGSVRQDGERLRIALRLVDVAGDRALWSESFDRRLEDVFAVQSEVARSVAEVLRLRLVMVPAGSDREDPALYRRFLLARQPYSANPGDNTGAAAVAAFEALVAEHPDYARAWGGLAMAQYERSLRPRAGTDALLAKAEDAAARALALDPGQNEALAVVAGQACREQRWIDCLSQSRRVVRLSPSDVPGRVRLAQRLAVMGYPEEAFAQLQEADAIAPDTPVVQFALGRTLDTLGRHDEAKRALDRARPLPNQTALLLNALWRNDLDDARRVAGAIAPDDHWQSSTLATIDALQDPSLWPEARARIEISESTPSAMGDVVDYNFMRMWLPERDYARDVAGLDRTQRLGFASYQVVFWQPESRALRQSPAFRAYLRESGLLELWRSEGWPSFCKAAGNSVACD